MDKRDIPNRSLERAEAKRLLRQRLAERAQDDSEDQAILDSLLGWDLYQKAHRIFCYVSVPGEPDTWAWIREALAAGKEVAVPRCIGTTGEEGGLMEAVFIRSLKDLTEKGPYGIPEPKKERATDGENRNRGAAPLFDLILAPCLACDPKGHRLGHGGGYYDRFLARQGQGSVAVALCYSDHLLMDVPVEPHDIPMNYVCTGEGILKCPKE